MYYYLLDSSENQISFGGTRRSDKGGYSINYRLRRRSLIRYR